MELQEQDLKWEVASLLVKPVSEDSLNKVIEDIKLKCTVSLQNVLVVEKENTYKEKIVQLASKNNFKISIKSNIREALDALKASQNPFDCIIMDFNSPEGFKLLSYLNKHTQYSICPVIISTSKELSKNEERQLIKSTENIRTKYITSKEQLLERISTFLNQAQKNVSIPKIEKIAKTKNILPEELGNMLTGKTLLMIDDDPRNIFAISSALESYGIRILAAENGREGIQTLSTVPSIDAVLMDIMMPEMDGYETITQIRKNRKYKDLPIIALTAKAMIGDKEKCIAAGATNYLSKPVDIEQLLSMLSDCLNLELATE